MLVPRPIAVIGAGVSGLSSAIRLREMGMQATIFADRRTPNTTSDRSAAVFTPMPEELLEAHDIERVRGWTRDAIRVFRQLSMHCPESGVAFAPRREFAFERMPRDEWWHSLVDDYHRLAASQLHAPYVDGHAARVPVVDMLMYMPWLEREFTRRGGVFVDGAIDRLDSPRLSAFGTIINCSGLGARRLADDIAVLPMRGQVIHIANEMGLSEALLDQGQGNVGTYIFPFRRHIVLGGTYELGEWSEDVVESDLRALVDRCTAMLQACEIAKTAQLGRHWLRAWAGLRPMRRLANGRESIRLETERMADGRTIIHNYGHGRCGVTLSWGCAGEVARLAATHGEAA